MNILKSSLTFSLILFQITDIFGDDCFCDTVGSSQKTCDSQGTCECKTGFIGQKCELIDENCDQCYKLVKNKLGDFVENTTELESYLRKYDEFEEAMEKLRNETRLILLNAHSKKATNVNKLDELTKNLTRAERKLSESLKYFTQEKNMGLDKMRKEISDIEKTLKSFKIPKDDVTVLDRKITQKLNKISKDQTFIDRNLTKARNLLEEIANNNRSLQEKLSHEEYSFDFKKGIIDEVRKLVNETTKNKEFVEYLLENVKNLQVPSIIYSDIDIESVKKKIKKFTSIPELTSLDKLKEKSKNIEDAFNEFNEIYMNYKDEVNGIKTSFDESEITYNKIHEKYKKIKRLVEHIQKEMDELNEAIRLYKEMQNIWNDFNEDLVAILKHKQKQHDTLSEIIKGQNGDLKKIEDHFDELNTNLKEIEYNDDQLNKCLEDVEDIERYIDDIDSELGKQEESIVALEEKLKVLMGTVQIELEKRSELKQLQDQVNKIKIVAEAMPEMECTVKRT